MCGWELGMVQPCQALEAACPSCHPGSSIQPCQFTLKLLPSGPGLLGSHLRRRAMHHPLSQLPFVLGTCSVGPTVHAQETAK